MYNNIPISPRVAESSTVNDSLLPAIPKSTLINEIINLSAKALAWILVSCKKLIADATAVALPTGNKTE